MDEDLGQVLVFYDDHEDTELDGMDFQGRRMVYAVAYDSDFELDDKEIRDVIYDMETDDDLDIGVNVWKLEWEIVSSPKLVKEVLDLLI